MGERRQRLGRQLDNTLWPLVATFLNSCSSSQAASQPLQQFWWSGTWAQFTCPPSNSLSHLSSLQCSGEVIDGRARSTRLAGDEKPRGTRDLGDLGLLAMHCMTATELPIARPPKRGPLGALPCQPETRCLCGGFLIGRVGARNRDSPHRCVARSTGPVEGPTYPL